MLRGAKVPDLQQAENGVSARLFVVECRGNSELQALYGHKPLPTSPKGRRAWRTERRWNENWNVAWWLIFSETCLMMQRYKKWLKLPKKSANILVQHRITFNNLEQHVSEDLNTCIIKNKWLILQCLSESEELKWRVKSEEWSARPLVACYRRDARISYRGHGSILSCV